MIYKHGQEGAVDKEKEYQERYPAGQNENNWATAFIRYCKDEGLIGNELDNKLEVPITRSEMVFAWSKLLQAKDMTSQNIFISIPDVTPLTPFYEAIKLYYEAGILSGLDSYGTFNPNGNINRAECATIFMKLIEVSTRSSGITFSVPPELIKKPVVITIDEDSTVTRPEVEGFHNLGWNVYHNGIEVLSRNAHGELSYTYFGTSPGLYEIYLSAFVKGQYAAISNTVSYTINDYGKIIVENAVPVQNKPIAESPEYINYVIENPLVVTIDSKNRVTRPDIDISEYRNLRWSVYRNGKVVIDYGSASELTYMYEGTIPGHYELFLNAFIGGGYVPVSNIVSYVIE